MIPPVAKCLYCGKNIYYRYQNFDEENIEGEPQFCCKKCKDAYIKENGKKPTGSFIIYP